MDAVRIEKTLSFSVLRTFAIRSKSSTIDPPLGELPDLLLGDENGLFAKDGLLPLFDIVEYGMYIYNVGPIDRFRGTALHVPGFPALRAREPERVLSPYAGMSTGRRCSRRTSLIALQSVASRAGQTFAPCRWQ